MHKMQKLKQEAKGLEAEFQQLEQAVSNVEERLEAAVDKELKKELTRLGKELKAKKKGLNERRKRIEERKKKSMAQLPVYDDPFHLTENFVALVKRLRVLDLIRIENLLGMHGVPEDEIRIVRSIAFHLRNLAELFERDHEKFINSSDHRPSQPQTVGSKPNYPTQYTKTQEEHLEGAGGNADGAPSNAIDGFQQRGSLPTTNLNSRFETLNPATAFRDFSTESLPYHWYDTRLSSPTPSLASESSLDVSSSPSSSSSSYSLPPPPSADTPAASVAHAWSTSTKAEVDLKESSSPTVDAGGGTDSSSHVDGESTRRSVRAFKTIVTTAKNVGSKVKGLGPKTNTLVPKRSLGTKSPSRRKFLGDVLNSFRVPASTPAPKG